MCVEEPPAQRQQNGSVVVRYCCTASQSTQVQHDNTHRRERSRAGICRSRPWRVRRHGIDDAGACVLHSASMLYSHPSTTNSPPGARSSSDRPTCVNVNTVASRLLQCSPRQSTRVDLGTVATCAERRCTSCSRARAVRIGHAPEYTSELLTATSDVPSKALLRSSNSGDFVVPATRLRLSDRAFSVAAARAWNTLPTELKSTHVTSTFKRKLKTFLYAHTYID